jgi:ABC-2 type transport system permease protein
MPGWMQRIAHYNPVDWAVVAGREALAADPDWSAVWPRLLALLGFLVVCSIAASRAFRLYQRSI